MQTPHHGTPSCRQGRTPALRIIVGAFSKAMSLSVALKRPCAALGRSQLRGFPASRSGQRGCRSPSFARWLGPGECATFRRSLVAWRIVIAQVCRRTCGDTRFDEREAQCFSAVRTCFLRMYSNPARVIHPSRALINSSGARTSPLIDSQARTADAVSFHSGMQRSLRPLPWTRTLGSG